MKADATTHTAANKGRALAALLLGGAVVVTQVFPLTAQEAFPLLS